MSIIIKGMEMPKVNEILVFDMWHGKIYARSITNIGSKFYEVVPLPEGHGRLGDLDKINASLGAMMEIEDNHNDAPYSWSHAYTEMQSILDDAPTIVPAEGGTDNGF